MGILNTDRTLRSNQMVFELRREPAKYAAFKDDITYDKDGVRVVVDPSSAHLLTGATLDYKDGLQQAGFSINNPNAQRTCGCGQSFS